MPLMRRMCLAVALIIAVAMQPLIATQTGAASPYLLPVPAGTQVLVYQGNNSAFDHVAENESQYAWDFTVGASEFPVVASRAGTVIGARSDSTNTSCRELSCWKDANYVVIDHGDGTSALYLHLATGSVAVKVGQVVKQGAALGRADCTGYSYGTHLHFMVETTPVNRTVAGWWWTRSISVTFGDAGPAIEGRTYLSANGAATTPTKPTPTPTRQVTVTQAPTPIRTVGVNPTASPTSHATGTSTPVRTPPPASATPVPKSTPGTEYVRNVAVSVLGPDQIQISFDWGYSGSHPDPGGHFSLFGEAAGCSSTGPRPSGGYSGPMMFSDSDSGDAISVGTGHIIETETAEPGEVFGSASCLRIEFTFNNTTQRWAPDQGAIWDIPTQWAECWTWAECGIP